MGDWEIAHYVDGIPERFVPGAADGALIEAEHLARYLWAAQIATGANVLDAGCGSGYGAIILAEAGAGGVTALDIAEEAVQAARERAHPAVHVERGDVTELVFEDASFDLVVCFEVLEHLEQPLAAVDELARVLTADGVLVVSSPNPRTYPPGNPHHHHEFDPDELRELLAERFRHVQLNRQHAWLASAVLDDGTFGSSGTRSLDAANVSKSTTVSLGEEHYTVAAGSNAELPAMRPTVRLASAFEVQWWSERAADLARRLEDAEQLAERTGRTFEETREVLGRRVRELEAAQRAAAHELEVREAAVVALNAQLEESDRRLRSAAAEHRRLQGAIEEIRATRTFRYAAPLRAAWGRLQRLRDDV